MSTKSPISYVKFPTHANEDGDAVSIAMAKDGSCIYVIEMHPGRRDRFYRYFLTNAKKAISDFFAISAEFGMRAVIKQNKPVEQTELVVETA